MFEKVAFEVDGRTFEEELSSFAIRQRLQERGYSTDVVLLYPVSLPFQTHLLKNERFIKVAGGEFRGALMKANEQHERFLENPAGFFQRHPHSDSCSDFLTIHSFGTYKSGSGQISLKGQYSDIVLRVLVDMIKRYLSSPDTERFIMDISSGHNVYVAALIEAARYFTVWLKLHSLANNASQVQIAISEPVIPGVQSGHRIFFEELQVKAMFASPLKYADVQNYRLSRTIYSSNEDRKKKQKLQDCLERFITIFSAIENNTPLAVYQFGYHSMEEVQEVLNQLIFDVETALSRDYSRFSKLDKNAHIKTLLSLGFYQGLIKILNEKGVVEIPEEGVELKRLREISGEIYQLFNLGLNNTIVGNEVDKIKEITSALEWRPLITLIKYGGDKVTEPQKRNFFAHAGLEGNVTECRIRQTPEGEKVHVRYTDRYHQTIKRWLLEALNE